MRNWGVTQIYWRVRCWKDRQFLQQEQIKAGLAPELDQDIFSDRKSSKICQFRIFSHLKWVNGRIYLLPGGNGDSA